MGRTVFHEVLNLRDGYVQLPEQEDGFQYGALVIIITAVSIFRMDGSRFEEAGLIIPHQRFFVYAVKRCELPDGK